MLDRIYQLGLKIEEVSQAREEKNNELRETELHSLMLQAVCAVLPQSTHIDVGMLPTGCTVDFSLKFLRELDDVFANRNGCQANQQVVQDIARLLERASACLGAEAARLESELKDLIEERREVTDAVRQSLEAAMQNLLIELERNEHMSTVSPDQVHSRVEEVYGWLAALPFTNEGDPEAPPAAELVTIVRRLLMTTGRRVRQGLRREFVKKAEHYRDIGLASTAAEIRRICVAETAEFQGTREAQMSAIREHVSALEEWIRRLTDISRHI